LFSSCFCGIHRGPISSLPLEKLYFWKVEGRQRNVQI
jgi:hypothetical protein